MFVYLCIALEGLFINFDFFNDIHDMDDTQTGNQYYGKQYQDHHILF